MLRLIYFNLTSADKRWWIDCTNTSLTENESNISDNLLIIIQNPASIAIIQSCTMIWNIINLGRTQRVVDIYYVCVRRLVALSLTWVAHKQLLLKIPNIASSEQIRAGSPPYRTMIHVIEMFFFTGFLPWQPHQSDHQERGVSLCDWNHHIQGKSNY